MCLELISLECKLILQKLLNEHTLEVTVPISNNSLLPCFLKLKKLKLLRWGTYNGSVSKISALSGFPVTCFHDAIGCASEFYTKSTVKTLVSYCEDFQFSLGGHGHQNIAHLFQCSRKPRKVSLRDEILITHLCSWYVIWILCEYINAKTNYAQSSDY